MSLRIIPKLLAIALLLLASYTVSAQQATLTINEDPIISDMLKKQKDLERENKLTIGYTIQLYYGELNKANDALEKYRKEYTDWPAALEYETPNYKVWAGNFSSRIEAERALLQIKKEFSAAFILKPERKK